MVRRNFTDYRALQQNRKENDMTTKLFRNCFLLLALALHSPVVSWGQPRSATPKWLLAYYLCLDNSLSPAADEILSALEGGIISKDLMVLLQVDTQESSKLARVTLGLKQSQVYREARELGSDESAEILEFTGFLDWIIKIGNAENYVLVLVSPPGKLGQICLDKTSGKWLSMEQVGAAVAAANEKLKSKLRLLFLHQSGTAAIENLFSFAGTSEYILASPLALRLPGTYYSELLRTMAMRPELSGRDVASAIMESDQGYGVYTLVDSAALKALPEKIGPVVDGLLQNSNPIAVHALFKVFSSENESYYDLQSFLDSLTPKDKPELIKAKNSFEQWYRSKLIAHKAGGPFRKAKDARYSGLSVFVPQTPDLIGPYKSLPFYGKSKFAELVALASQPPID
ncbi:MAG: hypothetical protein GX589_04760 [Deltaproteobacteria bacterium]|nr:hypothetical protein [Deltaproteobacteria bacterium]